MRPQRRIFLFSENNRYICSVLRLNAEDKHIFDESVLAFILEWKSGKFTLHKESHHTRHLVLEPFVAYSVPRLIRVWSIVFICARVFQNLHSDKLIDSTLSFC